MKLIQSISVLTMLLSGGVTAGETKQQHRMLGEDAVRLFGSHRVWHGGEQKDSSTPPRASLRQKQGGGQNRKLKIMEQTYDAATADDDEVPHYQAESLSYFKKEMDPNFFEWVNPDEIVPGGTTCGFMKPSLGSRLGETYPTIEVYVCARFANTQPAAKGNFFVHCGGPVGLSDCDPHFNEQNLNDFNIWSIDQRGLGRSFPNYIVGDCSLNPPVRDENGNITDIPPAPEPTGYTMAEEDVQSMKATLEANKKRNIKCWQHPDFQLPLGYHFLEYSGTRQLAEDIERMRLLMNAPYMHLWGISYGTTVMGTHATMFPESVGLFYIDSCESPNLSHYSQALSAAVNADQRIDYTIFSCEARNLENPGSCPVEDLPKCIADVTALSTNPSLGLGEITKVVHLATNMTQDFCNLASEGDGNALLAFYNQLVPISGDASAVEKQAGSDPRSQPSPSFGPVYGNPDYSALLQGAFPGYMVKQQDHTEPIYNADRFIKEVVDFGEHYTGAGSGVPVGQFMFSEYSIGYYAIKAAPLPQLGSNVKGIVAGALYDVATPYVWTQEMKDRFRNTKLITSQAPIHVAVLRNPACYDLVQHYFATGETTFTDGYICADDYPDIVSGIGEYFGVGGEGH